LGSEKRNSLLLLCLLARRQYGTVSVTADWECAAVRILRAGRNTYARYLTRGRGRKAYLRDVLAHDVICQMLTKLTQITHSW